MAILRPPTSPTLGQGVPVDVNRRKKLLREQFEQVNPQSASRIRVNYSQPQEEFQQPEKQAAPTGEVLSEQFKALEERKPFIRPELNPGLRVRNPNEALVDPAGFRDYFGQLDLIKNRGDQALAAEQAKAQQRRQQELLDIFARRVQAYRGAALNYTGPPTLGWKQIRKSIRRSAPLGMLGAVRPYVRKSAREISGLFGIGNIGGYATSGHIPGSDHYTGRAIDVMTYSRNAYPIVNYALSNAGRMRVKYVIYNRTYWVPGRKPVRYTGSNPHTGHVHISFY